MKRRYHVANTEEVLRWSFQKVRKDQVDLHLKGHIIFRLYHSSVISITDALLRQMMSLKIIYGYNSKAMHIAKTCCCFENDTFRFNVNSSTELSKHFVCIILKYIHYVIVQI